MKTKAMKAIAKGLLLGAALIAIASITGCTVPSAWDGKPNPLDDLDGEPTVEELHAKNIRSITGNPTL